MYSKPVIRRSRVVYEAALIPSLLCGNYFAYSEVMTALKDKIEQFIVNWRETGGSELNNARPRRC